MSIIASRLRGTSFNLEDKPRKIKHVPSLRYNRKRLQDKHISPARSKYTRPAKQQAYKKNRRLKFTSAYNSLVMVKQGRGFRKQVFRRTRQEKPHPEVEDTQWIRDLQAQMLQDEENRLEMERRKARVSLAVDAYSGPSWV